MGKTTIELVKDLEAVINRDPAHAEKARAIRKNAMQGVYHDFITDLATPKMQLHVDLLDAGLVDLDKKMQNGDYDDEAPRDTLPIYINVGGKK